MQRNAIPGMRARNVDVRPGRAVRRDSDRCGVAVVDLVTARIVGLLRFEDAVQEVFAVAVLRRRFPELINDDETLLSSSFVVPEESLPDVAETVRPRRAIPA